jgi:hypothetical protein
MVLPIPDVRKVRRPVGSGRRGQYPLRSSLARGLAVVGKLVQANPTGGEPMPTKLEGSILV